MPSGNTTIHAAWSIHSSSIKQVHKSCEQNGDTNYKQNASKPHQKQQQKQQQTEPVMRTARVKGCWKRAGEEKRSLTIDLREWFSRWTDLLCYLHTCTSPPQPSFSPRAARAWCVQFVPRRQSLPVNHQAVQFCGRLSPVLESWRLCVWWKSVSGQCCVAGRDVTRWVPLSLLSRALPRGSDSPQETASSFRPANLSALYSYGISVGLYLWVGCGQTASLSGL